MAAGSEHSQSLLLLCKSLLEKYYEKLPPAQIESFLAKLKEAMQALSLDSKFQEELMRHSVTLESRAKARAEELYLLENVCKSILDDNTPAQTTERKENDEPLVPEKPPIKEVEEIKFDPPIQKEEIELKNARRLLKLSQDFVRVFFTKTAKLLDEDSQKASGGGCLPTKCVRRRRQSKRANLMVYLFY